MKFILAFILSACMCLSATAQEDASILDVGSSCTREVIVQWDTFKIFCAISILSESPDDWTAELHISHLGFLDAEGLLWFGYQSWSHIDTQVLDVTGVGMGDLFFSANWYKWRKSFAHAHQNNPSWPDPWVSWRWSHQWFKVVVKDPAGNIKAVKYFHFNLPNNTADFPSNVIDLG